MTGKPEQGANAYTLAGQHMMRRADREATRDPRRSIAERYADNAAYVAAVRAAAAQMVAERLLLPMDAERAIEAAAQDTLSRLR